MNPFDNWQTYFSTFISPSGNTSWFTLRLSPSRNSAIFDAKAKRKDNFPTNPDVRVHIEASGSFIALLARDCNEPHGMVSMILHPDPNNLGGLRGEMIWNSLTDGQAGIVQVRPSKEIIWASVPSPDHPAAKPD